MNLSYNFKLSHDIIDRTYRIGFMEKVLEKLKTLENNGFEAYIVGGFVRDHILGIKTRDIDITTSAKPEDIKRIFNISKNDEYGSVSFNDGEYSYEITTFRTEFGYDDFRHPSYSYIDNLHDDLLRRDFTINTLCINSNGNIIDLLNSRKDLDNKLIRVVGDIQPKMSEDSLRILRAIRFASTYDFSLEEHLSEFIKQNSHLVKTLSFNRKREELDKILKTTRGIDLLKNYNLLEPLDIQIQDDFVYTQNILGIWAQIDHNDMYPFSKKERQELKTIRDLIKKGNIEIEDMLDVPIETIQTVSKILKIDVNEITKKYESMPIKSIKDLDINGDEITAITGKNGVEIKEIKKDLIKHILRGNLPNRGLNLKEYIKKYRK